MSEVWLDPGTHAVRLHESAHAAHLAIAEFFAADNGARDALVLVARRETFEGVAALLASGRLGPPLSADRIRFADAQATLAGFMVGDTADLARADAMLRESLAEVRRLSPGSRIRFYGEMVDVLCERGNFAAALALEGVFEKICAVEPRLAVLCGYARVRFEGAGAKHVHAIRAGHTHVSEGEGASEAPGDETPPPQTAAGPPAQSIYVIDDDASVRRSLGRFFKAAGWTVRVFDSGEAFLLDLPGLAPGCLVIDIQLGGMSGLDLLAHMQSTRPHWPAFAMSGSDDDNVESEALRLGVQAFLKKPLDAQALLAAIEAVLA